MAKINIWVQLHRNSAKRYRQLAAEYRRLALLTEWPEVREVLTDKADLADRGVRWNEEKAIEAEYGHLYEEVGE
jgi:hypothetical protein